jgi:transaldolase
LHLIREIVTIFNNYGFSTQILAAWLRSLVHAIESAKAGALIGTKPFRVLDMLFNHPLTVIGLAQFLTDYSKVAQEAAVLSR